MKRALWLLCGWLVCGLPLGACSEKNQTPPPPTAEQPETPENPNTDTPMSDYTMTITTNGKSLQASMVANTSTAALKRLLEAGPLTLTMHDYGNFEKVGPLGHTLPRNDQWIETSPGDIILYQGDQLCLYYDHNSWDFTRLGHIEGATTESMKSFLGNGEITVVLSL